jgi:hypothetical protein
MAARSTISAPDPPTSSGTATEKIPIEEKDRHGVRHESAGPCRTVTSGSVDRAHAWIEPAAALCSSVVAIVTTGIRLS